jgi:hypothetical protein
LQFYPPGWVPWPAGISCTATQWCAALNIDTFSDNENTGQFNNTACLNTVAPEPVNFAFVTNNGVATTPANAGNPEHFVPVPSKDFLMNPGDDVTVRLFDTANGLRVVGADTNDGDTAGPDPQGDDDFCNPASARRSACRRRASDTCSTRATRIPVSAV